MIEESADVVSDAFLVVFYAAGPCEVNARALWVDVKWASNAVEMSHE